MVSWNEQKNCLSPSMSRMLLLERIGRGNSLNIIMVRHICQWEPEIWPGALRLEFWRIRQYGGAKILLQFNKIFIWIVFFQIVRYTFLQRLFVFHNSLEDKKLRRGKQ